MSYCHPLTQARNRRGMSQRALSLAANVNNSTLGRIEQRQILRVDYRTLERMAQVLGVADPASLLDGVQQVRITAPRDGIAVFGLDRALDRLGYAPEFIDDLTRAVANVA